MPSWRQFCRGEDDLYVNGDNVEVMASNERRHRVSVRETADSYELMAIVARPAAINLIPDVPLRAWRRNRAMQLVGFRIDHKGRLIGEAWVPKAGLERDEFLLYIRRVASECDLFEYHLTGTDRE